MKLDKDWTVHVMSGRRVKAYSDGGILARYLLDTYYNPNILSTLNIQLTSVPEDHRAYLIRNLPVVPIPSLFSVFFNELHIEITTNTQEIAEKYKNTKMPNDLKEKYLRMFDQQIVTNSGFTFQPIPKTDNLEKMINFMAQHNLKFKPVGSISLNIGKVTTIEYEPVLLTKQKSLNEEVFGDLDKH